MSNLKFIGIGPPKTGTTWLYSVLSFHPEIYLTPDKEIRYWWLLNERLGSGLFTFLFSRHWHFKEKRKIALKVFIGFVLNFLKTRKFKWGYYSWFCRYFLGKRNNIWYESLFSTKKISGDIPPKYSELNDDIIAEIKKEYPELKVIITRYLFS